MSIPEDDTIRPEKEIDCASKIRSRLTTMLRDVSRKMGCTLSAESLCVQLAYFLNGRKGLSSHWPSFVKSARTRNSCRRRHSTLQDRLLSLPRLLTPWEVIQCDRRVLQNAYPLLRSSSTPIIPESKCNLRNRFPRHLLRPLSIWLRREANGQVHRHQKQLLLIAHCSKVNSTRGLNWRQHRRRRENRRLDLKRIVKSSLTKSVRMPLNRTTSFL